MLRSAGILFAANLVSAVMNLMRNVLTARLLSVEDFGIAASFSIFLSLIILCFGAGLGQFLIQATDGEDPRVQGTLQSVQLLMGGVITALIVLLGYPFSILMNIPQASWGFQLMGLVGMLLGMVHMDVHRLQRKGVFWPIALYNALPMGLSMLSIYPLVQVLGDWRAMPFALLVQIASMLVIAHLAGVRPFRLHWDRGVLQRVWRFGLPLMGNAGLMFIWFNAERVVVANQYGPAQLGWFSATLMLVLVPTTLVLNTLNSLFLPVLSAVKTDRSEFERRAQAITGVYLLMGAALICGVQLLGAAVLLTLYGADFATATTMLVLVSAAQGLRIAYGVGSIVTLARANSMFGLIMMLIRVGLIIPTVALVILADLPILTLLLLGVLGELITGFVCLRLMGRQAHVSLLPLVPGFGLAALVLGLALWQVMSFAAPAHAFADFHWTRVLPLLPFVALPFVLPGLRSILRGRSQS